MARSPQQSFFKSTEKAFGGSLQTRLRGRGSRPISTKHTMHLVLRSTRAKGDWSFRRHRLLIIKIVEKFARKYGVRVELAANVGNHLHMQIKLSSRHTYKPFIRAVTSTIATKVTGTNRWQALDGSFWDRRPFTRIVNSFKAVLNLKDYIRVNQYEGLGYSRDNAYLLVKSFGEAPS